MYDALKACGIRLISALPETWLVHLIRMAEEDPEMILVRLAKEEEGVGISAGRHLLAASAIETEPGLSPRSRQVSWKLYSTALMMISFAASASGPLRRRGWRTRHSARMRILRYSITR